MRSHLDLCFRDRVNRGVVVSRAVTAEWSNILAQTTEKSDFIAVI